MVECEKRRGFMDMAKDGLSYMSQVISASIFPPLAEGAEMVMKNIEHRIMRIERRILRKISSFLIIWFGVILLIFALLFFLIEFLGLSNAAAFFSIGIIVLLIGLLLKAGGYDR
jgi:hypothetical protein